MLKRLFGASPAMAFAAAISILLADVAMAGMGQPSPGQLGMQLPATEVAREINKFHDFVNIIIVVITLFVLGLMLYAMYRFSEKRNPTPSRWRGR